MIKHIVGVILWAPVAPFYHLGSAVVWISRKIEGMIDYSVRSMMLVARSSRDPNDFSDKAEFCFDIFIRVFVSATYLSIAWLVIFLWNGGKV